MFSGGSNQMNPNDENARRQYPMIIYESGHNAAPEHDGQYQLVPINHPDPAGQYQLVPTSNSMSGQLSMIQSESYGSSPYFGHHGQQGQISQGSYGFGGNSSNWPSEQPTHQVISQQNEATIEEAVQDALSNVKRLTKVSVLGLVAEHKPGREALRTLGNAIQLQLNLVETCCGDSDSINSSFPDLQMCNKSLSYQSRGSSVCSSRGASVTPRPIRRPRNDRPTGEQLQILFGGLDKDTTREFMTRLTSPGSLLDHTTYQTLQRYDAKKAIKRQKTSTEPSEGISSIASDKVNDNPYEKEHEENADGN